MSAEHIQDAARLIKSCEPLLARLDSRTYATTEFGQMLVTEMLARATLAQALAMLSVEDALQDLMTDLRYRQK